jgi:hypothetical protein
MRGKPAANGSIEKDDSILEEVEDQSMAEV